jgi:hypothetical protein
LKRKWYTYEYIVRTKKNSARKLTQFPIFGFIEMSSIKMFGTVKGFA